MECSKKKKTEKLEGEGERAFYLHVSASVRMEGRVGVGEKIALR